MKKLTCEEKQEIKELYLNKSNKVADIAKAYGIQKRHVTDVAVEGGATPRKPNFYGVKKTQKKYARTAKKRSLLRVQNSVVFAGRT